MVTGTRVTEGSIHTELEKRCRQFGDMLSHEIDEDRQGVDFDDDGVEGELLNTFTGELVSILDGKEVEGRVSATEHEAGGKISVTDEEETGGRISTTEDDETDLRVSAKENEETGGRISINEDEETGGRISATDDEEAGCTVSATEAEEAGRISSVLEGEVGGRISCSADEKEGKSISTSEAKEGRQISSCRQEEDRGGRVSTFEGNAVEASTLDDDKELKGMLEDAGGLEAVSASGRNDKERGMSHIGDGTEVDGWYKGISEDEAVTQTAFKGKQDPRGSSLIPTLENEDGEISVVDALIKDSSTDDEVADAIVSGTDATEDD